MLSFEDCIDMCDLAPDEEREFRDRLTLAEISGALSAVHSAGASVGSAESRPCSSNRSVWSDRSHTVDTGVTDNRGDTGRRLADRRRP